MSKTVTPYGCWDSPISAEQVAARTTAYDDVRIDGEAVYWLESRPQEDGRTALVVDDMVDTGGTLAKVAHALTEAGAREVLASASHAVLSGKALERIEESPLSKLIVTDSIPLSDEKRRSPKMVVLSIAELMGKAIRNIHEEASVTSLFV